ncbi:MAG: hypothetical protein ACJ72E_06825 [Marmoricola sp.]
MLRSLALATAAAALVAGCGGTSHEDAGTPPPAPRTTTTSTTAATPGVRPTTPAPRTGLPSGYPLTEVPLVDGRVQTGDPGTPDGAGHGWDVHVVRSGSAAACLAAAGRALEAKGFTRQVVMTDHGTHQAQYTSPRYAVLISVDDDHHQRCSVTYTVGALGQ